jgi:hypothetical protein
VPKKTRTSASLDHLVILCLFDNAGGPVRAECRVRWGVAVTHVSRVEGYEATIKLDLYLCMLGSVPLVFWVTYLLLE